MSSTRSETATSPVAPPAATVLLSPGAAAATNAEANETNETAARARRIQDRAAEIVAAAGEEELAAQHLAAQLLAARQQPVQSTPRASVAARQPRVSTPVQPVRGRRAVAGGGGVVQASPVPPRFRRAAQGPPPPQRIYYDSEMDVDVEVDLPRRQFLGRDGGRLGGRGRRGRGCDACGECGSWDCGWNDGGCCGGFRPRPAWNNGYPPSCYPSCGLPPLWPVPCGPCGPCVTPCGPCGPCGPFGVGVGCAPAWLPYDGAYCARPPVWTSAATTVDTVCSPATATCYAVSQPTVTACGLGGCATTPIGPPNLLPLPACLS